ncbi:hypothetical protein GCM10007973_12620 [Polymorphobacter multimanifer]|nr:hypothetical protein GCM10007973_12620 [Polymorphobacter multimanifer]
MVPLKQMVSIKDCKSVQGIVIEQSFTTDDDTRSLVSKTWGSKGFTMIRIDELEELDTVVGLFGTTLCDDVGGPPCVAVIVGIIVSN